MSLSPAPLHHVSDVYSQGHTCVREYETLLVAFEMDDPASHNKQIAPAVRG